MLPLFAKRFAELFESNFMSISRNILHLLFKGGGMFSALTSWL